MDCQVWYAELSVNHLVTGRPSRSGNARGSVQTTRKQFFLNIQVWITLMDLSTNYHNWLDRPSRHLWKSADQHSSHRFTEWFVVKAIWDLGQNSQVLGCANGYSSRILGEVSACALHRASLQVHMNWTVRGNLIYMPYKYPCPWLSYSWLLLHFGEFLFLLHRCWY